MSFRNPASGPDGEPLGTDCALLGPLDASHLMIAMSGTHGAEGFCGSGVQTGWLRSGMFDTLPADTAVLLIHAINPYGFAHVRRVTEDNVDLNRNFVNHAGPLPRNHGYEQLREALCPKEWSQESEANSRAVFHDFAARNGEAALQSAITSGQYVDAEGIFYGGVGPTWSRTTLHNILAPFSGSVRHAAFIDLHTGLGPYGIGEIMCNHQAGERGHDVISRWWGSEATYYEDGTSSSSMLCGDTNIGVNEALPNSIVGGITLEYGTRPLTEMLDAVRADNWLYVYGDPRSRKGREIKAQIRDAFYPDRADWKDMVFERARYVMAHMLACVAAEQE